MVGPDARQFRKLITRGNLDGIACAAVFLERFPDAEICFVTSPPAAIEEARRSDGPVLITDLPLNAEMADFLNARDGSVHLVDHHPISSSSRHAYIVPDRSAAGALHEFLGHGVGGFRVAALADVHECSGYQPAQSASEQFSLARMESEIANLDLAWRYNIEDDDFRRRVALSLSRGSWPSEMPEIRERSMAVRESKRWSKATSLVADCIQVRGNVGVLDLRGKRCSLHGFGSVALAEVARTRGCDYSLLLHDSRGDVTASLRCTAAKGMDVGKFLEEFTAAHGVDGGGHPASAGARVPASKVDLLIGQLVTAA